MAIQRVSPPLPLVLHNPTHFPYLPAELRGINFRVPTTQVIRTKKKKKKQAIICSIGKKKPNNMIRRKRRDCGRCRPVIAKPEESHRPSAVELHHSSPVMGPCLAPDGVEVEVSKEPVKSDKSKEDCGREKLQRLRSDVAGRVWIPEIWGQEELLKDWIDCAAFDGSLIASGIMSARDALVEDCRRANSGGLRIENPC